MDNDKFITQTAGAAEEYIEWRKKLSLDPIKDLKALAVWYDDIEPGKPGTYAMTLVNRAIEEFGQWGERFQNCEGCAEEDLLDDLISCEFAHFEGWFETYFDPGDMLLLDVILQAAKIQMEKG